MKSARIADFCDTVEWIAENFGLDSGLFVSGSLDRGCLMKFGSLRSVFDGMLAELSQKKQ